MHIPNATSTINQKTSLPYRSDIDGLRAIAVVVVVLYHYFPRALPGGFIGVDIFFVISGYLITKILIAKNSVSILNFYKKRIHRIIPALCTTIISTLIAGWFLLGPDDYKDLAWHTIGGTSFTSNILLWLEAGYFDKSSELKPFLHLWSLSIEEQFYIFWPILVGLSIKYNKKLSPILLTLGTLSLIFSLHASYFNQNAGFYIFYYRAWELLTGGLLTQIKKNELNSVISISIKNILSFSAVLSIVLCIFLYSSKDPFPSWRAIIPVAATAILIFFGPDSAPQRLLLSNRILVGIGLISFPLYLTHWPILSMANLVAGVGPDRSTKVLLLAISAFSALLIYAGIERKLRHSQSTGITFLLVVTLVLSGASGWYIYRAKGIPNRSAAHQPELFSGDLGVDKFEIALKNNFYPCPKQYVTEKTPITNRDLVHCFQSKIDGPITVAIIGDSHAEHFFPGIAKLFPKDNVAYFMRLSLPYAKNQDFEEIFKLVAKNKLISTVFIAAFWSEKIVDLPNLNLRAEIGETVYQLTSEGKRVFIMDQVPRFNFGPKKCKFTPPFSPHICTMPQGVYLKQRKTYLESISNISNSKFVNLSEYFCRDGICSMTIERKIMYRDEHHLNMEGSQKLADLLFEIISLN